MSSLKLVIVDGPDRGREFPLVAGENVMGRTNETEIELPSTKVSRRHAAIIVGQGGVEVADLGSSNGTFLNGKRIQRSAVPPGAKILVGDFVLQVVNGNGAKSGQAARPKAAVPMSGPAKRPGAAVVVATPQTQRVRGAGAAVPVAPSESAVKVADAAAQRIGGFPWRVQVFIVLAAVGLALFVDIFVIVSHAQKDYQALALERARLVTEQLASQNAQYMASSEDLLLNADVVKDEDGVKFARLIDRNQFVLLPASEKGGRAEEEAVKGALQAKDFTPTIEASSEYPGVMDIAAPVRSWNRTTGLFDLVGVAYVQFDPGEVARHATAASTLYIVSALILAVFGAGGAMLLIRTTEPPIGRLQEDVELLIRGDLKQVQSSLRMREFQALVHSINRLAQRQPTAARASAADIAMGMVGGNAPALPMQAGPVNNAGAAATVKALASAMEDAVLVVDQDNKVVEVNAVAERMFGLSPARVRGQHLLEAISDKQLLNDVLDLLNEVANAPSGVVRRAAAVPDGEGGTIDGHVSAAGVRQGRELAGSALVFSVRPMEGGG